jgi:hypothetical protein
MALKGGGEVYRFYLEEELEEEFSPDVETNVALVQSTARHHVTDHITTEWSGCDS